MLFSSIPFLYYFLPLVIGCYFLLPLLTKLILGNILQENTLEKVSLQIRNAVLLLFSLVFYGWGEPSLLWLMIFTIVLFYGCGLAIGYCEKKLWKRIWLTVSIVISVALLGFYKYADFFIDSFNSLTGLSVPLL